MRDRLGNQKWQARANAEKSFVFRDHDRVLEFHGRDLLTRRMDVMGHSELRQGTATTGGGHRSWRESGAISKHWRWFGLQGKLIRHLETESCEKNVRQRPSR